MSCPHERIDICNEWHEDMHCEGWRCHDCSTYIDGGCHPRSWCRDDFCGVATAIPASPATSPSVSSPR